MTKRELISSNTKWEKEFAYSRIVKYGNTIEVAGTTAVDEDGNVMGENAKEQAEYIFKKIDANLKQVKAGLMDVVRTRMYITDPAFAEEVGKAHGAYFKNVKPASTMVVAALINKNLLVEIEVTAVI